MSLSAVLCFTTSSTKTHNLVDCKYQSSKQFNKRTHHPDADAKCGVVEFTVIPKSEDFTFYDWYINNEVLSGSIIFDLLLSDIEKRTLTFENAYCISVAESYNIAEHTQKVLKLEFIAETMDVGISTKIAISEPNSIFNTNNNKTITLAKLHL